MIVGIFSNFFHTHHFYRLFCVDETNQKEIQGSCVLVTLACTVCDLSLDSGKVEMNAFNCAFIHLPASVRLGLGTQNAPIRMCVCVHAFVNACLQSISIKWIGFGFFFWMQKNTHTHIWRIISNWFLQLKNCFCNRRSRIKWNMMRTVLSDSNQLLYLIV